MAWRTFATVMRVTRWGLALVLVTLSCSDVLAPPPQEVGDFATMQALWATHRRADYTFELAYTTSFVPPIAARLIVRDHRHRRTTTLDGRTTIPTERTWVILTLDSLYTFAARLQPDTAGVLDLRYDPRTGMITRLSFDVPSTADEEFSFTVLRYVPQ